MTFLGLGIDVKSFCSVIVLPSIDYVLAVPLRTDTDLLRRVAHVSTLPTRKVCCSLMFINRDRLGIGPFLFLSLYPLEARFAVARAVSSQA
jgi:hypothetical protein